MVDLNGVGAKSVGVMIESSNDADRLLYQQTKMSTARDYIFKTDLIS